MEEREFDVIEFLERLDELTADCETEEEAKEIYIEEIEKLTDEEAEEFYRAMKESELLEEDDCECEECAKERVTSKYVPVITEHLEGVGINADEFDKGVDDVSRICGQFSALKSVGMSDKDAMDIITNLLSIQINKDTIEGNVRIATAQDVSSRI